MTLDNLNQSDWQSVVFSSIMIFILLGSVLTRRELTIIKIIKYLFIWAIIAVVCLAFYSYRYSFYEFGHRLYSEINPSKAAINHNQLIIRISDDGHFYLNSEINHQPVRFMVDTGASDIVLNIKDAQRVGINTNELIFNKVYQTANGEAYGASVKIKEFMVSGVIFSDVYVSINSAEMSTSLLGMSFLKRFSKYEFYQDKLVLTL